MFGNIYGLDLGTYEIKVFDKNDNDIFYVKDALAIKDNKNIIAIGNNAYEMYEKTPANIEVVFPMKEGVISRFNDMQYLLKEIINTGRRGSEYVIAVPTDVTEVEKKAFYDLVIHSTARAKGVSIVDRGVADAVGLGLDVRNEKGIFVANFGAETTEFSVISYGGIVINKLMKRGAMHLDSYIQNHIRSTQDFLIGKLTAEQLRIKLNIFTSTENEKLMVTGRNLITGVPEMREIDAHVIRTALREPLQEYVKAIRALMDRIPPDILRAIDENGIYVTGGLSKMQGFEAYMAEVLSLKITKAKKPEYNAIKGISKIIMSKDLKELTYSMLDKNYRWMR